MGDAGNRPDEPSSGGADPADEARAPGRILVVDDEPDNLVVLRMLLTASGGYEVDEAHDGIEALERIRAHSPDLVLLDVMMPRKDGFEVCGELKASEQTRDIPVVLLTARNDVDSKVRGLDLGADDYIAKPFHPREVLARVRSLLTVRDLQRQLLEAERAAAAAQVAVTVLHEVNNALSAIVGNTELLRMLLEAKGADPNWLRKLDAIETQTRRIQDTLSRIRGIKRAMATRYVHDTQMISLDSASDEDTEA